MYWLVTFGLFHLVLGDESRLVHLYQGPVRGYKDLNDDIFVFYSIPYAKAPTGHERFKAPLPPPHWSEPFEAVDKNIICPQADFITNVLDNLKIQEDCLIANIYVPVTNNKNLPVVVYVHGGAYVMGWGDLLTPKKLVSSKKVIVVTFNYRLGAHGFLCLGTKDVPGNAGMKDQVALLRWINKNIAKFGGDPDEVTIAGYSAGSSSVDLLTISKMAQGLFKRIIPESGSSTAAFSVQLDPIKNAKEYAISLNFDKSEDLHALENFFKNISFEKLNSPKLLNKKDSTLLMSPCVERDVGDERVIDESPVNILKTGNYKKLPMLYGLAEMEGMIRIPVFEIWKNGMNEKFSDFLPADLQFKDEIEKEQVAKDVKSFYFGNKLIGEMTFLEYINYFTDIVFAYPILRSIKLQVEAGNREIYLYEYSFVDDATPVVPHTNVRGATHTAQTFAVLDGLWNGTHTEKEEFISKELGEMKSLVREIWLNFMTTGKPIAAESNLPAWPPVGLDWSPHMSINKSLELRGSLLKERALFWEKIYDKYHRYPIAPTGLPVKHIEL